MKDTAFDYKTQKILVDLNYATSPCIGDRMIAYYRLGLIRALYPNSHITASIHPVLKNFKFREANETIYTPQEHKCDYSKYHIIFRHVYITGCKRFDWQNRSGWDVLDRGLDHPLQEDPNDRDFTKPFKVNKDVLNNIPLMELRNEEEVKKRVKQIIPLEFWDKSWAYLNFRDCGANWDIRNLKDDVIGEVIKKLSKNHPDILFIFHTFIMDWIDKFKDCKNVFLLSNLDIELVKQVNFDSPHFRHHNDKPANYVDYRLSNELIFYMIKKSKLFVGGDTGLGVLAQYAHPNLILFSKENESTALTSKDKYFRVVRTPFVGGISKFGVEYVYKPITEMIKECVKSN